MGLEEGSGARLKFDQESLSIPKIRCTIIRIGRGVWVPRYTMCPSQASRFWHRVRGVTLAITVERAVVVCS